MQYFQNLHEELSHLPWRHPFFSQNFCFIEEGPSPPVSIRLLHNPSRQPFPPKSNDDCLPWLLYKSLFYVLYTTGNLNVPALIISSRGSIICNLRLILLRISLLLFHSPLFFYYIKGTMLRMHCPKSMSGFSVICGTAAGTNVVSTFLVYIFFPKNFWDSSHRFPSS